MKKPDLKELSWERAEKLGRTLSQMQWELLDSPQTLAITQGLFSIYKLGMLKDCIPTPYANKMRAFYLEKLQESKWALEPFLESVGYFVSFDRL